MRKLMTLFLKVLPVILIVISFTGLRAQTFHYTIENQSQVTSKILEFDLMLLNLDPLTDIQIATVQAGVTVNPATYNGGTVTAAIVAGSSTMNGAQVPTSCTFTQSANVVKLAAKAPPGCGGGTLMSSVAPGTRLCRIRLTNTADWTITSSVCLNATFCFTTTPYPTKISWYDPGCVNVALTVNSTNCFTVGNICGAVACNAPTAFNVTGSGSYCQGGPGLPVGLSGSEADVVYTLFKDGIAQVPTVNGTGGALSFGNWPAGTYTVTGTRTCPTPPNQTTTMTGSAVITETPVTTNEFTASACDSYTWALNGVTYTASGDYTYIVGCVTNILHLTITPSSTVEFTASACDSYTWALNGVTYTASGNYNYVVGCVTNILHLTITPSSTVEFTASGCDSYTWALNGVTYTTSGDYTYVSGCVTNILHLTITPSSTVEFTASACDTYTWALNGVTYTASGDYTYVVGCVTNILHLTITPSSTVEFTAAACDSYTWALNGVTYTASGDYTYVVGCVTNILHLTITPSGTNEYTASACDSYTWALNGVTYTASGDYTFSNGCSTNILHLTITPSSTVEFTAAACDSYTWALNGVTYTASGDYNYVVGCVTNILHLTITPSSTVEFTEGACDSYTWALNGVTYTASGNYTYVVGCVTNILHLTITPSSTVEFTASAIGSYTWALNGVTYYASGDYTYVVGCVTNILHLTIINCPATSIWNGNINSDWFNAANWTPPLIPCTTTAVIIPIAPNYPTLLAPAAIASITINSGASFIGSEFLTTGVANVYRDFPVPGYHYISSPIMGNTFGQVFPLAQNQVWAYLYDEPTGMWMNQTVANTMNAGVGYSVKMNTPQTATFVGQMVSNPVLFILSNFNPSTNVNRKGWNLVGNPYTSALNWNFVPPAPGMDAAVYVWNGFVYLSYVGGIGSLPGGIIPAENGFMVKANIPGAPFIIPFGARVHSGIPFYKESVTNLLSLKAEGNSIADETFVNFNENATSGFDSDFDAFKLMGIDQAPAIYSMAAGEIMSVNALPKEGNEVVDLGFKCGVSGTYNLTANGMESFDATTPIWLEDLKTGAIQNLRTNPAYSFTYNTSDVENRFKLHFKSAYSVPENSLSGINIYSVLHTVVINNTTNLSGEVRIYDLTGRELTHTTMSSQNETRIPVNAAVGTYMVKVITGKGVASSKVFIR